MAPKPDAQPTPFAVGDRVAVATAFQTNNKGQHKLQLDPGDQGLVEEFSATTGSALLSFDKDTSLMHWIKILDFPKLKKVTGAPPPAAAAAPPPPAPAPGPQPGQAPPPVQYAAPPPVQYAAPPVQYSTPPPASEAAEGPPRSMSVVSAAPPQRLSMNESLSGLPRSMSVVLPAPATATVLAASQSQGALGTYQAASPIERRPSGVTPTHMERRPSGVIPTPTGSVVLGGSGVFQQPPVVPPKIGEAPRLSVTGSMSLLPGSGFVRSGSFVSSPSMSQLVVQPPARRVVYLPMADGDIKLLEQESPNKFRVLGLPSGEGLAFRGSKDMADATTHFAWKDNYINGIDEGDGWVKCELEVPSTVVRSFSGSFSGAATPTQSPSHRLYLPAPPQTNGAAAPPPVPRPCAPEAPEASPKPEVSPKLTPRPVSRGSSCFDIYLDNGPQTNGAAMNPAPAPQATTLGPMQATVPQVQYVPQTSGPQVKYVSQPQPQCNGAAQAPPPPAKAPELASPVAQRGSGLLSMMSTKDATEDMFVSAARESNLANHGADDFDTHLHVTDGAYNLYLRRATLAEEKVFGGLNPQTANLRWAVDTYFSGEAGQVWGLQLGQALLFWDHILTFGAHSFLIVTRTHVAHRADYVNAGHRWLVRLDEIEGLQDVNPGIDRDGRRRLRLSDGRDVTLCAAMGAELHALVANLARRVRSQ